MKTLTLIALGFIFPLFLLSQKKSCIEEIGIEGINHFFANRIQKAKSSFKRGLDCPDTRDTSFFRVWLNKCKELEEQFSVQKMNNPAIKKKNAFTGSYPLLDYGIGITGDILNDTSFIISGRRVSKATLNDGMNMYLACLSITGRILWEKEFEYPGNDEEIVSTRVLKDGSILIGGIVAERSYFTDDIFIAKFNAQGKELWRERIDLGQSERLEIMSTLSDSSIMVAGQINKFDETGSGKFDKAFIAKLTKDGKLIYKNQLPGTRFNFKDFTEISNKRYLYVLSEDYQFGTLNFLLTDENLNIVSQKKMPNNFIWRYTRILAREPNDIYIATMDNVSFSNRINVMRTKVLADTIGCDALFSINPDKDNLPISLSLTNDNHLLISGAYDNEDDIWLYKSTWNGTKIWETHYGGYGGEKAFSTLILKNNNILTIGYTIWTYTRYRSRILAVLFNENGGIILN
jgi:hypothetical protein